jgi:signal transduction protein with GAF and PtsI domain
MKKLIGLFILLGTLAGCQSVNKQFAAAYGTNTLTRKISTELLDADKLSSADGLKVKAVNDEVREGLDAAWAVRKVYADSSKTAVKKHLSTVQGILNYLENKEIGK